MGVSRTYAQEAILTLRAAGVYLLAESFPERIHLWEDEAKRRLWKYWWGLPVLFLIGLVEAGGEGFALWLSVVHPARTGHGS